MRARFGRLAVSTSRRVAVVGTAAALTASVVIGGIAPTPATANTAAPGQMNACWSKLTSTWATFPLVITGSVGTPVVAGGTTTKSAIVTMYISQR